VANARFVQRVAKAFQTVGDQGGSLRLRLSPPDLGSLRLNVTVSGGVLSAHVQTETAQARDMLMENLPALRERLAEHNIKVDQFDVEVFDSSTGGSSDQPHGNSDPQQAYAAAPARNRTQNVVSTTSDQTPAAPALTSTLTAGGLNVVI
jgi:flagellar hook-length control protein FliK